MFAFAALASTAQTAPTTAPDQPHQGKVIFSRSTDENGQTTTETAPPAPPSALVPAQSSAQVNDRTAITFTAFDLDVRLRTAAQQIAVRAQLTLRNDGIAPLSNLPLQLSSALNWESIRVIAPSAAESTFKVATLNSDTDHTGQLHEAVVPLAVPLAPGASLQLDVTYSGTIAASAQRLLAIGAPDKIALHADWDQISFPFTGLRGFGNVVWYPVASQPVLLGDGARLFDEMGEEKLRLSGARFRLRLTVESPHGQAPTLALINGRSVPLTVAESSASLDQSQEVASIATADSGATILGFEAPSLFVVNRTAHPGVNLTAWTLPENNLSADAWSAAAAEVSPLLEKWLGQQPHASLTLLDLPDAEDAPFETGSLLAAPLGSSGSKVNPEALDGVLVHALTHAWIASPTSVQPPPAWLNEGLAGFMGSLWVEKQHGREAALRTLEADRTALALAEPESPGQRPGQPLAQAISPVYYRTKAAYVLWMLRDLVGDQSLSAALRAYNPGSRTTLEQLLEEVGDHPDLKWFFAAWIDADKGLPDLKIAGVYPTSASGGNWLVAVNIVNSGYAAAELPITVHSASAAVTRRIRIPAHGEWTERILLQGRPTEVQVNDGTVPETQSSIHNTKIDETTVAPTSTQPKPN